MKDTSKDLRNVGYKLLRLVRGKRYVIAIQDQSGEIEPHVFWDEVQALAATATSVERWDLVTTEVFTQVFSPSLPAVYTAFMRKDRKGLCLGVVLWRGTAIYPFVFPTLDDAVAAALQDDDWFASEYALKV